jgi:hypothetical protein
VWGEPNVYRYRGEKPNFIDAFECKLANEYDSENENLTIIACGPMVPEAMRAAWMLKEEYGIETRVLNYHTLKPFVPDQAIRAAAKAVLSLERNGDTPDPLRAMRGDDAARSLALLCGPQARRNWRSLSRLCRSELTAARWLRQNKEHVNDPRKINRMFRAHEDAVDDGLTPDTPEYFAFVEDRLGIAAAKQVSPPRRQVSPPSAPVSRESGSGGVPGRSNVVRLTSEEREAARFSGLTDQEYAKQKLRMMREAKG